ncbi:hypothetical protein BN946_scf184569.g55 [Trametes cinnabarina]|uniref:Uncharacterized protein n=1 Tax=Pycnoporus cinnabarinus TaxID=5643 RepID=A0A060S7P0_PYCCI|nr:hypothetical protein BN946_scf184569.g55 [Trametes cinnabarina]
MSTTTAEPVRHRKPSEHDLFLRLQTIDEMVRANEEAQRRLERITERRRIPPVPDLRFEYSYIRSVAPYIHVDRTSSKPSSQLTSEKGKERALPDGELDEVRVKTAVARATEIVRVDWGQVLWITTRDQIISPLLQGALWYVLDYTSVFTFSNPGSVGVSRATSYDH